MQSFVVEPSIRQIYDAIVLYHPDDIEVDDVVCESDKAIYASLLNKQGEFIRLKISFNEDYISTSVGICFSNKKCFVEEFWLINWFALSQYNVVID